MKIRQNKVYILTFYIVQFNLEYPNINDAHLLNRNTNSFFQIDYVRIKTFNKITINVNFRWSIYNWKLLQKKKTHFKIFSSTENNTNYLILFSSFCSCFSSNNFYGLVKIRTIFTRISNGFGCVLSNFQQKSFNRTIVQVVVILLNTLTKQD